MKRCFALSVAALILVGCKTTPKEPLMGLLGDKAPKYSQAAYPTVGKFLEGQWSLEDAGGGKGFGNTGNWKSDVGGSQSPIGRVFDFQAGGQFTFKNGKYTFGGAWQEQGSGIGLTFNTMNGQPLQQALADIKKRAEVGTQAAVAEGVMADWIMNDIPKLSFLTLDDDQQKLVFDSNSGSSPGANASLDNMMKGMAPRLERIGPVEEK